jgi:CheY-like chemotaxis protein
MVPSCRSFPPPWTIEELNAACFIVSDANGQKFATDYESTEVESGEEALVAIAKQRPDLILMDIQLPIQYLQ